MSTGRGWHLYFAVSGLPTKAAVLPGIDVRGMGGYVVAPPSVHPSGHRYAFVDPESGERCEGPASGPFPPVPGWVVQLCRQERPAPPPPSAPVRLDASAYARAALKGECADVVATPEGARNDRLNRAAFAAGTLVGAGALDAGQANEQLLDAALRAGLSESEARRTIASGLRAGSDRPRQLPEPNGPAPRPFAGRGRAAILDAASKAGARESHQLAASPERGRGPRR